MYCIKCGVELAKGEKKCPLCDTRVYHPDIKIEMGERQYPVGKYPSEKGNGKVWQVLFTAAFALPAVIVALCDLRYSRAVTWSGYVIGALLLAYVSFVLPFWFKKRTPVIFVPVSFFAAGLYVLYCDLMTGGGWFLSFGFPVVGILGAVVTAVVVLMKYLPCGRYFIFGGAFVLLGGSMLLLEFLMTLTFTSVKFVGWSLYPLAALCLLGAFLIFLGICRPARETMARKFFV